MRVGGDVSRRGGRVVRLGRAPPPDYTVYIATDPQLLQIVDDALDAAAQRAGDHLACYAGCAVCCFGPFPITAADAQRLQQGLESLKRTDLASASAITHRAEAARKLLSTAFPGDPNTGDLHANLDEAAFAARFPDLACPVLDPASGRCLLHEARPIACRLYGLPTRVDGADLPHCPLCFRRASQQEIEAARAIIDFPKPDSTLEAPLTVIAYAFHQELRP